MANTKGKNAKSKHPIRSITASIRTQTADQRENAKIREIASKAELLSDPLSDIRKTGYWACKHK